MEGARRDPEFQSRLRVMDIDEQDLQQRGAPQTEPEAVRRAGSHDGVLCVVPGGEHEGKTGLRWLNMF